MQQSKVDAIFDRATDTSITLNGKPATIAGRLLNFGWVCALDQSEKYEWSWESIERILEQGGAFISKSSYHR